MLAQLAFVRTGNRSKIQTVLQSEVQLICPLVAKTKLISLWEPVDLRIFNSLTLKQLFTVSSCEQLEFQSAEAPPETCEILQTHTHTHTHTLVFLSL